ncbi:ATP-binding protein [Actinacidiphila sp. ITFR-21]|uniref:ATP-binding protein n=1 Tax=Actinacidiphila sp. ITFR-21 TaxID=3075199 RepID=UPI00288AE2B6|nr:ATP-binding protein [Streptomyces sp. ITFR-21]WNI14347.1 ATP-binding protein [Streptomyces sp. ITFR-21]
MEIPPAGGPQDGEQRPGGGDDAGPDGPWEATVLRISEVYGGETTAIAEARRFAAGFFGRVHRERSLAVSAHAVETTQLVVSELISNAVRHTAGPCRLDLELVDHAVDITVWDTSSAAPAVPEPDPARVGRHGIEVVLALCGAPQITRQATGKRISVRVALEPAG